MHFFLLVLAISRQQQHHPKQVQPTRAAALAYVTSHLTVRKADLEGARHLAAFFDRLHGNEPVHILQYGDSHTASDDWVDAMRKTFQAAYGDGGSGFTLAGHPYKGYRRWDAPASASAGWTTEGTMKDPGTTGRNGLGGISITATQAGETVSLTTSCSKLEVYALQQPGGGAFNLRVDSGEVITGFNTDGPLGTQFFSIPTYPGTHTYTLTTTTTGAPVRLFGWAADNERGVTWETLGINGAQARMIHKWGQEIWREQFQRRTPALVVLAYGTNEALYPYWTAASYRAELLSVIQQIKEAAAADGGAAILMIGPPACGKQNKFGHLNEIIEMQRQIARQTGCAFFDWKALMERSGGRKMWVTAGLSQPDYVHLTPEGYRQLGAAVAKVLSNK